MSAEISWLLTDCQPRCWLSVDQLSTEVSIEYWSRVDRGLIKGIDRHSIADAFKCTWSLQIAIIFACDCYVILSFFRYRLCVQQEWDRFSEDLLQTPHMPVSRGSDIPSSEEFYILSPATCRWKNIYMRALSLDRNWAQGRYSVAPLLRGHKDPITCMACDGN